MSSRGQLHELELHVQNTKYYLLMSKEIAFNHQSWHSGSALCPLSKRSEVQSPPLANGANSMTSFLLQNALTEERRISLTTGGYLGKQKITKKLHLRGWKLKQTLEERDNHINLIKAIGFLNRKKKKLIKSPFELIYFKCFKAKITCSFFLQCLYKPTETLQCEMEVPVDPRTILLLFVLFGLRIKTNNHIWYYSGLCTKDYSMNCTKLSWGSFKA